MFLLLRDEDGLCVGRTGYGVPLDGMTGLNGGDDVLRDGDEVVDKGGVPDGVGGGLDTTDVKDEELKEMLEGLFGTVKERGEALKAMEDGGRKGVVHVRYTGLKASSTVKSFAKGVWWIVSKGGRYRGFVGRR